ncbi:MAG: NADH-quinone oxidoreductase subunit D, partial [Actinomycetota bacterium]|nr:NADH-quinone oxidoreductase subunit D [Actinomycetota bacterium]
MTTTENPTNSGSAEVAAAGTSEGRQELQLRKDISTKEILRGSGAVLRMSESEVAALAGTQSEDQTMIINMGPQHP